MRAKRKKRERKRRLRNASLRISFMLYMLTFSVLAIVLILITLFAIGNAQNDLYWQYARTVTLPITNSSGEASSSSLTVEIGGEAVSLEELEYYGNFDLYRNEEDVPIAVTLQTNGMPASASELLDLYEKLEMLSILFWIIVCLFLASFLFYRNKLKKPLAILQNASVQIAQNNLDFHVAHDRRDEMGKLCDSFEKMRAALYTSHTEMWRAMEERKRLNAAFSHDLRTPLTVLHGYMDLLAEHTQDGALPPERVRETLGAMSNQLSRLDRYVESMQSMQRLEDVAISVISVDSGPFVDELHATASIVCDAAGKTLSFSSTLPERPIAVDPSILLQVYENLLSNAVRFAAATVSVSIQAAANTISLTVSDDGHGFSTEALARAKDPFYSSGNTDSAHFGLGLNICDVLCGKHGGWLTLRNLSSGGGSVEALFAEKPEMIGN